MSRSYSARVKRRVWTGGMRMRWTNDTSAGCASQRPRCDARGVGRVKNLTDLRVEPQKVKHELTPTISDRKDRPCGPASPIRRPELQLQGARPGLLLPGTLGLSLASFPPVMCRMTALAIASLRRPPFSGRAALASAPGLDALQRVAQAALLATEVPGVEWVRQDHTVGPYGRRSSVSIRVLPFRVLP